MNRVVVALNCPRTVPEIIVYAQSVALAMTQNPAFPSPIPALSSFTAHIAALEKAQVLTLTHVFGAAAERNAKLALVRVDLSFLRAYVQTVADASAGDAAAIIASAGLDAKGTTGHPKPDFVAKQGRVSGTARLVAKAPKVRTSYEWQRSTDGETWVDVERTMRADADILGLAPGTRYFFRYRTLTKDGTSDWSQVVSLIVS